MKHDYSKIKYLAFSAEDEYSGIRFQDIIINLENDSIEKGYLTLGKSDDPYKSTYNLNQYPKNDIKFQELLKNNNGVIVLTAKISNNTGSYYLLDNNYNRIYECIGYVPHLMDYYNFFPGYGDYIRLTIKEDKTLDVLEENKKRHKTSYNYDDDWKLIMQNESSSEELISDAENNYLLGFSDGLSLNIANKIENIIVKYIPKIVSEIISVLNNINNKTGGVN